MTRRPKVAAPAPHAELTEKYLRAVVADHAWQGLLPLPIDGVVLVPSRSIEWGDHECRIAGRHVLSCSGKCGMHPDCFHRAACRVACWQEEHPNWLLPNELPLPLLTTLIREYGPPPTPHQLPYFAAIRAGVDGLDEHHDGAAFSVPAKGEFE